MTVYGGEPLNFLRTAAVFALVIAATAPLQAAIAIPFRSASEWADSILLVRATTVAGHGVTFEVLERKARMAEETFRLAGVNDEIELIHGDARDYAGSFKDIAFCFLDSEKDIYREFYDMVIPNMVSGGLLVADNVISHADKLQPFVDHALSDERVDAVVVPIGRGELLCRRC